MSAKERLKAAAWIIGDWPLVVSLADALREIETLEVERDQAKRNLEYLMAATDDCNDATLLSQNGLLQVENARLKQQLQAAERRADTLRTAVITTVRNLQDGYNNKLLDTLESILEHGAVSEAQKQSA